MNICIFTLGSRGDVQPYLALAKELMQSGHTATICTGSSFQMLIESQGIPFVEVSADFMALAKTSEGKAVLEHPLCNFRKVLFLSKYVLEPAYQKTLRTFFSAAKNADCIIYHPKALGAVDIALYYDIPCISMPLAPIAYPIKEFPNPILTTKNLGSFLNRLSYQINGLAEHSQMNAINDFRIKVLSQKPRKAGLYTRHMKTQNIPIIYPFSRSLFPEVKSWNDHVFLSGFFYLKEENSDLPDKLQNFLNSGPRPIAVTFSSMPLKSPDRFLSNLKTALKKSNNRAVLLSGNSGMRAADDAHLCVLPELSHQQLFSHVKAVIHHGGAGTTAAALRAGLPQLIIPFSADQPFWAKRMQLLGVGLHLNCERSCTAKLLTRLLLQLNTPERLEKALLIADKIRVEHGTETAVREIEFLLHPLQHSAARISHTPQ